MPPPPAPHTQQPGPLKRKERANASLGALVWAQSAPFGDRRGIVLVHCRGFPPEAHRPKLPRALQAIDTDCDGRVSMLDVATWLTQHVRPVSLGEAQELFQDADRDGEGLLDFNGFLRLLSHMEVRENQQMASDMGMLYSRLPAQVWKGHTEGRRESSRSPAGMHLTPEVEGPGSNPGRRAARHVPGPRA